MSDRVQELFDSKIRKVVLDYERNNDVKSIAAKVGVSPPTIAKWLKIEGYKWKKKGRIPLAMKARVKDLSNRGWDSARISSFLELDMIQVSQLLSPISNPILGGEKDPLKVKGQKKLKKDKTRSHRKPSKSKDKIKQSGKWPPDKHKCRKHWTSIEESYVLELMEKKLKPIVIYKRMRASKERQIKIWRKNGGKGTPPNFPPPKEPPNFPVGGVAHVGTAAKAAGKEAIRADAALLKQLEFESESRRKRIKALEASAIEEERQIKILESEQKRLMLERVEKTKRLEQAKSAISKRTIRSEERRRVIPGSYEQEVLGLKVGDLVEPGSPGRPAIAKPESLGEYADNGRYFTVSKDWADLEDASKDELSLFASHLNSYKFPTKVESSGDQPKAFYESTWPKSVESKWIKAVESGIDLIEKYRDRRKILSSNNMFSKGIAKYLSLAYTAYGDKSLNDDKKNSAKESMLDEWQRIKKVDRLIMIFDMGVAEPDGEPTSKGVERGLAAKILLDKASKVAAKKLEEKSLSAEKKRALEEERKAVRDILRLKEGE